MSCRGHGGFDEDNCVCGVLRAIVEAQDQVSPDVDDDDVCDTSCERSIQKLLGEVTPPDNGPNTIPVILYCDCEPFVALGVGKDQCGKLECFNTILFRVNSVDENCCATIELLTIGEQHFVEKCDDIAGQDPADTNSTGICMTVDLSCFCAVTCLDPIRL